jgi:hypothetical protein
MRRAGIVKACNVYPNRDDGGDDATTTMSPTTTKPKQRNWYGIVLYQTSADAQRAVQKLHQSMLTWNRDRFRISVQELEKRKLSFHSNRNVRRPTIQSNQDNVDAED